MAKYKLVSLSVQIKGKVFHKRDNFVFDTENTDFKEEIETSFKNGFLELVESDVVPVVDEPVEKIQKPKNKNKFE